MATGATGAGDRVHGWWLRPTRAWLGRLLAERRRDLADPELGLAPADVDWLLAREREREWVPLATAERVEVALVRLHGGDPDPVMREAGARAFAATARKGVLASPIARAEWALERRGRDLRAELRFGRPVRLAHTTRCALRGYLRRACTARRCELLMIAGRSLHFAVSEGRWPGPSRSRSAPAPDPTGR